LREAGLGTGRRRGLAARIFSATFLHAHDVHPLRLGEAGLGTGRRRGLTARTFSATFLHPHDVHPLRLRSHARTTPPTLDCGEGSTPVSANFPSQSYYVQNDHPDDMEILWYTNHSWTNPGYFEYYVNIWDDHTGGTISDTLHVEDYAGYMVICFCCGRFAAGFPAVGLV
jgi:hypothetical protein